ncbi:SRPBCC domain-containing protein [Paenibacillus sp. GCM10027627]|uniref:SRPBCC domain-containing protein n=1 Tax=unclassified Paenibacillus TaxID=185978 RepID=UPI00363C471C
MIGKTTIEKNREKRELTVERIVALPRKLAWEGWTKPVHVARWWGPKQWTATIYEMDVRPGGIWRYSLSPEGGKEDAFGIAEYREVSQPSRLEYMDMFADHRWNVVEGSDMLTAVTFEEVTGGTKLSIVTRFATVDKLEEAEAIGMIEGYSDALERLETAFMN